jgi:EF-P beta-lysylation protein EpmB
VIPEILPLRPKEDWQYQLRTVISTAGQLLEMLGLQPEDVGYSAAACNDFALKVPLTFARRIRPGDPRDPLLLQVLARSEELTETAGFGPDPLGEVGAANPARGIIHKYHGRVLLIISGGCAINCRYCFRRHFPYKENQNSRREWREALGYIRKDSDISEVIFSGGDPLLANDDYLGELVTQIAAIGHVRRLRIHTRLPVVIPDRVTPGLVEAITRQNLQTVTVIHSNHASEIDTAVEAALGHLSRAGITLLNQSVLLAGVNDNVPALTTLSERLFAAGVLPYYLHLLDRVQGAAHFDVPEARAAELVAGMTATLPGYLVPKLVREVSGAPSKVAVHG